MSPVRPRGVAAAGALWHDDRPSGPLVDPAPPAAVDLAIVGGGLLGLGTALWTARLGRSVAVFDAKPIGHGASGLNGGQVIPGLKLDPDALIARFGPERGRALVAFAAGTADSAFDLIAAETLDVPRQRAGWVQAAHNEAALRAGEARARQWMARGQAVEILDAKAVAGLTGAAGYRGGLLDKRAGSVQPFAYVTEFARIAAEAGAQIFPDTPVLALRRDGAGWSVRTQGHAVLARQIVLATNAETDGLVPGLARTILALPSFQIATAPLDPAAAAAILPGGQAVCDSRRIVTYYRKSSDGRLVLGGRGTSGVPRHPADWAHLERAMRRLFPILRDTPVTHRWSGRVAMTLDHLPHVHEPSPGLVAVLGCQGRGVGLMTALGKPLAHYLATRDPRELPFAVEPLQPIPLHGFRRIGVAAVIAWSRLRDRLER